MRSRRRGSRAAKRSRISRSASRSSSTGSGCSSATAAPDRATLIRWQRRRSEASAVRPRSAASRRATASATCSTAAGRPTASRTRDRGRRLREMLDELGPTFVKFGQLLSTRPDVVPPDIIVELRKLQDDVTPFPVEDVERGRPGGARPDRSSRRSSTSTSSRSRPRRSARCTARRCRTTAEVVVKVQRPEAPRQIESDLKLMASAARVDPRARARSSTSSTPETLVDEFARSIRLELDYQQEARNAETFRRNFAGDERIAVPRVWWRYTTSRAPDARPARRRPRARPRPRRAGSPRSGASSRTR